MPRLRAAAGEILQFDESNSFSGMVPLQRVTNGGAPLPRTHP